MTTTTWRAN